MTKEQLQQELLEKVKPGTLPSHLKRSKSADDIIPNAPPLPPSQLSELEQLKKQTDLNSLLQDQLKAKQKEIEKLRKQLETNSDPTDFTELDQALTARHQNLKD
jgi:predicted RNase H-like nuclease (RuvC/YqgF family)